MRHTPGRNKAVCDFTEGGHHDHWSSRSQNSHDQVQELRCTIAANTFSGSTPSHFAIRASSSNGYGEGYDEISPHDAWYASIAAAGGPRGLRLALKSRTSAAPMPP